ncbi:hypothetical protein [Streptococcus hyovaginalis]|uniref:hypothetical protein n=1 Tax=Streptococcus hyovaginalis TaxID=149015 RepID=UPI00201631AD|nr:hypothetical protein [Streptococcus hyovaginalis]
MAMLIARHGMSYQEAYNTTLVEFQVYNLAYAIQLEEKRHHLAIQAWFNQSVQATKGKGKNTKSAYKTFDDFYNHQEMFNSLFEAPKKQPKQVKVLTIADRNRLMNQRMKKHRKGG